MLKKLEFKRHTGKVIVSGFENMPSIVPSDEEIDPSFLARILETEVYLNDKVATTIHRKFGIAIRFHL